MNFDVAFGCGMVIFTFWFVMLFWMQRVRVRRNRRLGKKRFGFYPRGAALGNAFQVLQVFAQPAMQQVVEEKQDEHAEEDDEGGKELTRREYGRQLRRIRRGEKVGRLRVPFR